MQAWPKWLANALVKSVLNAPLKEQNLINTVRLNLISPPLSKFMIKVIHRQPIQLAHSSQGVERVFDEETHGENFKEIADEYIKTHQDKVVDVIDTDNENKQKTPKENIVAKNAKQKTPKEEVKVED